MFFYLMFKFLLQVALLVRSQALPGNICSGDSFAYASLKRQLIRRVWVPRKSPYRYTHLGSGVCTGWGEMFASDKNRNQAYKQNQCRGEPYVRPPYNYRNQTYLFGNKCMGFRHRFLYGFCSEGEHKVRPYIGFAHRLDFGLTCNFGYTQMI